MFDRVDRSHTDINVKQQPNDSADAARLHGEIRAKAFEEVRQATCVKFGAFNELTVVRIDADKSFENNHTHVRMIFKLNGHMYDIRLEEPEQMEVEAMTVVAQHLVSQVLNKLFRNGRPPP